MIRLSQVIYALLLGGVAAMAVGQTPGSSVPAAKAVTPHSAHSEDPLPEGGKKANPADAASPPLADPLKQQAVTDPPQTLATPAVQFIMQASMDSLTDIQLARAALKQGSGAAVRRFARRMLADQGVLNGQLQALAIRKGTSVPGVLDSDHAGSVQKLASLSGRVFDTAYVARSRTDGDRTLTMYGAASVLNDADVGGFVAGALPALRAEQAEARLLK